MLLRQFAAVAGRSVSLFAHPHISRPEVSTAPEDFFALETSEKIFE
jgi:hypothetical protein